MACAAVVGFACTEHAAGALLELEPAEAAMVQKGTSSPGGTASDVVRVKNAGTDQRTRKSWLKYDIAALDFEAARQVDVECVTPAGDTDSDPEIGGGWRSVASVTNARAFQARRSAIRYRREDDSEPYVHTLTAELALAPLFATVLEYYQNEDETVTIPDALRGHVDGQERIEGREPALADAATDR